MGNIFILYMPPDNAEAMVHYRDTIRNKVLPARIYPNVSTNVARKLSGIFGQRPIAVWGSRDTPANRSKFDRMSEGDEILIVEGPTIKLLGKVACKEANPKLSRELWQNLRGETAEGWDLIYFIANPLEIDLPFTQFKQLIGFEPNFQLRGFMAVSRDRLADFYEKYDDLYSILIRLKEGKTVEMVAERAVIQESPTTPYSSQDGHRSDFATDQPEIAVSDHLKMQWMLLKMGKQAGQRVWAPRNDQSRITAEYDFRDFEDTFAAGLDAQVKYIENIDVVWKEEFRIDAAFEVENSTSIYSGLLRFADLTMVAPNTIYPMFIVAPGERRNRVREQLARPTFKHLHLAEKVRYLSYEKLTEIDDFFGNQTGGLCVDLLTGRSETFQN